jgi:hypothetical protein
MQTSRCFFGGTKLETPKCSENYARTMCWRTTVWYILAVVELRWKYAFSQIHVWCIWRRDAAIQEYKCLMMWTQAEEQEVHALLHFFWIRTFQTPHNNFTAYTARRWVHPPPRVPIDGTVVGAAFENWNAKCHQETKRMTWKEMECIVEGFCCAPILDIHVVLNTLAVAVPVIRMAFLFMQWLHTGPCMEFSSSQLVLLYAVINRDVFCMFSSIFVCHFRSGILNLDIVYKLGNCLL